MRRRCTSLKASHSMTLLSAALTICVELQLLCFSTAPATAYMLPDTGQTKCYQSVSPWAEISCTDTGQDGEYNINQMSYTDNSNGTVTDNNTGLIWQKLDDGNKYNWYQATGTYHAVYNPSSQNVCGTLNLGGYSDWRLPAIKELISIVDYSIPDPGPVINATYFPNTHADYYWSFTTYANEPDSAWLVFFYWGSVFSNSKDGITYVRCVRGGQAASSLFNNGDGTVIDHRTGLMWQQGEPGLKTWGPALSYCEGLSLAGHTDWRLPNIKELVSLTDYSRYWPAIDRTFFPSASPNIYCSSTTKTDEVGSVWTVNFSDGAFYVNPKVVYSALVRCVRGICPATPIAIDGLPPYYSTIHDAYSIATDGHHIQIQALDFTEDGLDLNKSISISILGGYDCDFSTILGFSTIHGSLIISNSTVTIANLIIQ